MSSSTLLAEASLAMDLSKSMPLAIQCLMKRLQRSVVEEVPEIVYGARGLYGSPPDARNHAEAASLIGSVIFRYRPKTWAGRAMAQLLS